LLFFLAYYSHKGCNYRYRILRKAGVTMTKKSNKAVPKKLTRFKGETKLSRANHTALRVIKSFKGMFG